MRIIVGCNLLALAVCYAIGFSAASSDPRRTVALAGPLILIAGNFTIAIFCLLAMAFFHLARDPEKGRVADRLMQAFMVSFGFVLCISVPACMAGAGLK